MPLDAQPNQEFLKFISIQGDKKNLQNLELILNLEKNYPGMFIKVMSNFNEAKSHKKTPDKSGKKITWEEALINLYLGTKYVGVSKENEDIAELYSSMGLPQVLFDYARELRQEAKSANIPEHILGQAIREETILESIERIKEQTKEELASGKEMIEELYDKQFTYEWLSKYDPHNSIIGLFCGCCASITEQEEVYGSKIALSSVIAPDVQNLVVRNSKGDIISKGTMYVNKAKGYAVINDFELNEEYRNHEKAKISPGRYSVEETSQEEQDRDMIFKAFQRGLRAFIEEYDRQNPKNPLTQINIGMGYNRLKKQVERFKMATSKLTVPSEYSFEDAMYEQYILYKREPKQIENGGQDK